MPDSIALCTGTVSNTVVSGANVSACSVSWVSAPYAYAPSIDSALNVQDVVDLSWLVVAVLVAAFCAKQLMRVP